MKKDRDYLKWCLRQNKGIRLVQPSDNLVKAYFGKSRNALKSMEVNAKAGVVDWAVSASYYARYFAVYALLSKLGVKCEIHDCTIALFDYLFRDKVSLNIMKELRQSKENRIEVQYYTRQIRIDLDELSSQTKDFVLEIEKLVDSLNSETIADLQRVLRGLTKA